MSKNFKSFIISCLISISTIGVMGTTSFADDIEGTERFAYIGIVSTLFDIFFATGVFLESNLSL